MLSKTVMQKTRIELQKWFMAIGLMVNARKSLSSCQLARDLSINQRSAWYMMERIRAAMAADEKQLLQGIVEAEQTYMGGKPRKWNRHSCPPHPPPQEQEGGTSKTPVIGAVERNGRVTARVADDLTGRGGLKFIQDNVSMESSLLITDEYRAYRAGRPLPDQVEVFCDTWTLDEATERSIRQMPVLMRESGVDDEVAEFWRLWMNALRNTQPRLLAYLAYMAERLLAMKHILRPSGSVYLHCDPEASHYIKVLMDSVFGHNNFQNEIVWRRTLSHDSADKWGPIHDTILFYSASSKFTWNRVHQPYNEGVAAQDIIFDIPPVGGNEDLGYDTRKPRRLLERIIEASTSVGDMVLEPFCGCATTLEAAHRLERKWIGIDMAIHAVKRVAVKRLDEKPRLVGRGCGLRD